MRIYRYLFSEVSKSFMAVAIVLTLIFVSGRFVKYLAEVAAGTISSEVLFSIMLFRLPGFMEMILPLALFMGIMLAFGRLYVESEMVVLQACGISKRRLLFYTLGPAMLVTLMTAVFTLYLTPLGWKHFDRIWNDPDTYSGLGTMVEGSFKKFDQRGIVVYTADMNAEKTRLSDVFIVRNSNQSGDNRLVLVKSARAEVVSSPDGTPYIELHDGMLYNGEIGRLDFTTTRYQTYGQRMVESGKAVVKADSVDGLPTGVLIDSAGQKEKAALYWRIAMPFIVPVIALIALALSETNHRKGRYMKLLPGIIIYILYIAVLIGMRTELEKGAKVPAELAFWLVHGGFLLLGLVLLYFADIKARLNYKRNRRA